jgi:hypothetical protein
MPTLTEIASRALRMIGEPPIMDIDDTDPVSTICRDAWPGARDEILRGDNWSCVMARAELARLVDAPPSGWSYYYGLPTDWLRTVGAWENDAEAGALRYEHVAGKRLATDAEQVFLRYVRQETDPTMYDAALTATLVAKLAEEICEKISGNANLAERMRQKVDERRASAAAVSAIEQPAPVMRRSPWVTRRF